MTDADLITLAEREQARLTNEGDNAAAAIMRALVDRVRGMPVSDWLRGVVSTTVPKRIIPRIDRSQDWRNN